MKVGPADLMQLRMQGVQKKKQKLTKPDTKNSIYKHPKRRRRSRGRQGTAAQSFANESTIFYCHCWALNAKHKHAHKHTQIKETNNLDHLFAFTLCSCACCLISIYLYNFNLSALRGRTPHKSKVFLTYVHCRKRKYIHIMLSSVSGLRFAVALNLYSFCFVNCLRSFVPATVQEPVEKCRKQQQIVVCHLQIHRYSDIKIQLQI